MSQTRRFSLPVRAHVLDPNVSHFNVGIRQSPILNRVLPVLVCFLATYLTFCCDVGVRVHFPQSSGSPKRSIWKVRVEQLSFWQAFLEGYLLPHEYAACYGFIAFVFLVITMGLLLAREEPAWAGHLSWTGILVIVFTFLPAAKWFGTYEVCGYRREAPYTM